MRKRLELIAVIALLWAWASPALADGPAFSAEPNIREASAGVPTDASLGTNCGTSPSSVSEDFSANDADGNGAAGTPSGSACFLADASAGPSPTSELSTSCGAGAVRLHPRARAPGTPG